MTDQEKFEDIVAHTHYFAPKFRTSLKSDSKLHLFIAKVLSLLGNKQYLTNYWTTIGQWCARPTICNNGAVKDEWQVACHEGQHARDANTIGNIPFAIIYLFPQIIGLLGIVYALLLPIMLLLGAPSCLWWGLLSLLALLPLPAIGRAYLEYRAYVVTLACNYWTGAGHSDEDYYITYIVNSFVTANYYWMFPFKKFVTKIFKAKLQELKNGTFVLDAYLALIKMKCSQYRD